MIAGYYAECNSCKFITKLRIGIGHDENQKFKYECQNCNSEVTGVLELNQSKGVVGRLKLDGAKVIDSKHHDYVFTFHPFFSDDSSYREYSSPFVNAANRNIDDFPIKIAKIALFKRMSEDDIKTLKKIYKNYKLKKWPHFSDSVKKILPDWPLDKQIDRNRALYQILEWNVFPVVTSDKHSEIIHFLVYYLIEIRKSNDAQFVKFITELNEKTILETIQDKSFNYTFRFFELETDLRPIIVDWDPNNPDKEISKDLKIRSNTPFDKIKSFYVDGYELACDALVIIQGLINLRYRGNIDLFPEHPHEEGKRFAKSLDKYNLQPNAPKLSILFEENFIDKWINSSVDPILR